MAGHLSHSVLSVLRKARIYELNLTETITDAGGLNLGRSEILKGQPIRNVKKANKLLIVLIVL